MKILNDRSSVFRYLEIPLSEKANKKISKIVIDSRNVKEDCLFFGLEGKNTNGSLFAEEALQNGASLVVSSNKSFAMDSPNHIFHESPIDAMAKIASGIIDDFTGNIIGVTGSSGKTTVKNLIKHTLDDCFGTIGNYNNEIGLPFSVMNLSQNHKTAVFELAAGKPKDIDSLAKIVRPHFGIITSIGHAHLKQMKSIEGVLKTKSEIIPNIREGGFLLIPHIEYVDYWKSVRNDITVFTFGDHPDSDYKISMIEPSEKLINFSVYVKEYGQTFDFVTNLLGMHNIQNITAAFICSQLIDNDYLAFQKRLEAFKNNENRLSVSRWINGSTVINDTYNANPESTVAGIKVLCDFPKRKIMIFGDMLELGTLSDDFHKMIGNFAKDSNVDLFIGFGNKTKLSVKAYGKNGLFFNDAKKLNQFLAREIKKDDIIYIKGSRGMKMERFIEE